MRVGLPGFANDAAYLISWGVGLGAAIAASDG